MDKMIKGPDGQVLVTNDGATIVEKMEIEHPIARLLVELSQSQDDEIGDGTTGVVVLAGGLIRQALLLLDKDLHPLKIASGFEKACDLACENLKGISKELDVFANENEYLVKTAMTSLGSKIVSKCKRHLAEIAVKAVLSVADLERKDVNFDLIKVRKLKLLHHFWKIFFILFKFEFIVIKFRFFFKLLRIIFFAKILPNFKLRIF